MPKKDEISQWKNFISGGCGGAALVISGHPFDTIKVRLQTMPKPAKGEAPLYRGMIDCSLKTIRGEGFRGLYKGMATPLVGIMPLYSVLFLGYSTGLKLLMSSDQKEPTTLQIGAAGMLGGVYTTAIMAPGERIKCLLQTQPVPPPGQKPMYSGPIDVVRKLYRVGGVSTLFRGTAATLLRDVPCSAVYFMVYENLIHSFLKPNQDRKTLHPGYLLLSGGFAGIANWLVALPADTLKTRLQTAPEGKYPNGVRSVLPELLRTDGVFGLYRGIIPVLVRAFPANACCFLAAELSMRLLNSITS